MTALLSLLHAASPAVLFLALPFLASTAVALIAAFIQHRLKSAQVSEQQAGPWLESLVRSMGLPVRVAVSAEITGSMDGFWPRAGVIGLSPRTWTDRSSAGRAIGSHEVGHALLWRDAPDLANAFARARQVYGAASVTAASAILVAALMDSTSAAAVGMGALVVALACGIGVLLDEAHASVRGAEILDAQGLRTRGTDLSMILASTVYAVPMVVQLGFLLAAPRFVPALVGAHTPIAHTNSDLGLWAILFLGPVLMLRAAHVLSDVGTEGATSEFRLNFNLFQERSWEFHSSVIVLLWLFLTYDEPVAQGLAPLFVLGALPAMATLGAIGRLVVVMPIATVLALTGFYDTPQTGRSLRYPAAIQASALLDPDPGLWTRAASLVRISWTPLLLVLLVRAVQGW